MNSGLAGKTTIFNGVSGAIGSGIIRAFAAKGAAPMRQSSPPMLKSI